MIVRKQKSVNTYRQSTYPIRIQPVLQGLGLPFITFKSNTLSSYYGSAITADHSVQNFSVSTEIYTNYAQHILYIAKQSEFTETRSCSSINNMFVLNSAIQVVIPPTNIPSNLITMMLLGQREKHQHIQTSIQPGVLFRQISGRVLAPKLVHFVLREELQ